MNSEDKNRDSEELELRMIAMLLGESSAAEKEELHRLIDKDPALARQLDRLKATIGWIAEAAPEKSVPEQSHEPAQLDENRRRALLMTFGGPSAEQVVIKPARSVHWAVPLSLAASIVLLIGIVIFRTANDQQFASNRSSTRVDEAIPQSIDVWYQSADLVDRPESLPESDLERLSKRRELSGAASGIEPLASNGYVPSQTARSKNELAAQRELSRSHLYAEQDVQLGAQLQRRGVQVASEALAMPSSTRQGVDIQVSQDTLSRADGQMNWALAENAPVTGRRFRLNEENSIAVASAPRPELAQVDRVAAANEPSGNAALESKTLARPGASATRNVAKLQQELNVDSRALAEKPLAYYYDNFTNQKISARQADFAAGGISNGFAAGIAGAPSSQAGEPVVLLKETVHGEAFGRIGGSVGGGGLGSVSNSATPAALPEIVTEEKPFSTFSLNVSDVSFQIAAAALSKGLWPEVNSIRTEEFVNAFNYGDPQPAAGARVAFNWEHAQYPFAHDRQVLRLAINTGSWGRAPSQPLNLVLLLDNSGSMERPDRVAIVEQAIRVLATTLQPEDRISVVAFARTPRLWVDGMPGGNPDELLARVLGLAREGGTNLEEALSAAFNTAERHFMPEGQNRVILLSDGAANLGNANPDVLREKVTAARKRHIAFDCFGVGWDGYNDQLLELLSRNGNGRYGFLNDSASVQEEFADQLTGALQTAAADVKVQVEFNPKRVSGYRQVGYAQHQLSKEDFRDNQVDAAELAADESGNALYVIRVNHDGTGPLGTVRVRYRVPSSSAYEEREWTMQYNGLATDLNRASPSLRLATAAGAFAEWLAGSPFAAEVSPDKLLPLIDDIVSRRLLDPRATQLHEMIRQAQSIARP